MLDEDCDIGKLEGSVEECGVQGFAEWEVCGSSPIPDGIIIS